MTLWPTCTAPAPPCLGTHDEHVGAALSRGDEGGRGVPQRDERGDAGDGDSLEEPASGERYLTIDALATAEKSNPQLSRY